MKTKLSLAVIVVLAVVGLVVQVWLPRVGVSIAALGFLAAAISLILLVQRINVRLARIDRRLAKLQQSVSWGNQQTTKYGNSIFSRVKNARLSPSDGGLPPERPQVKASVSRAVEKPVVSAGRVATPDVKNPFSDETLATMLMPGRLLKAAGLYDTAGLPPHDAVIWEPGEVLRSLELSTPDVVVLDEEFISHSPVWGSAMTAVGAGLMKELVQAQNWAKRHGVQVFLLPATVAPDVFSKALRGTTTDVLPLDQEQKSEDYGAAHTALFEALVERAARREVREAAGA
ncbi:MAG: hypothetical protein E7Z94_01005 [Actinomyces ruminicola]|nr:hypothetical protein [Actinomyces ruminicola]